MGSKRQCAEVECDNEVDADSRGDLPQVHKRRRTKDALPCDREDLDGDDELNDGGLEVLGSEALDLRHRAVPVLKLDDDARKGSLAASASADVPCRTKPAVRLLISVREGLVAARTTKHGRFVGDLHITKLAAHFQDSIRVWFTLGEVDKQGLLPLLQTVTGVDVEVARRELHTLCRIDGTRHLASALQELLGGASQHDHHLRG
mmetsp:Transcript_18630/g.36858  ORF Transcript_18630/g.36858 Transcript_18630/m.36858 type:complete len:204 (-) Transcript_18630:353-964(-)